MEKNSLCHLKNFEEELIKIRSEPNSEPYHINTLLPSWDYYYDLKSYCWYKLIVTSKNIETSEGLIKLCNVSAILFDYELKDDVLIRLKSNEIIKTTINRKSILINSILSFAQNRVGLSNLITYCIMN